MLLQDKAAEVASDILRAFQMPKKLPAPLAEVYIERKDNAPCRAWSLGIQIVTAMHGHSDARSYDQWKQVGRYVKSGEKAFYLHPALITTQGQICVRKEPDLRYGLRGAAVFGLSQTDGEPLPVVDLTVDHWLKLLPLRVVVDFWGLSVEAFNGRGSPVAGQFWCGIGKGGAITLGVRNLSTWAHELVHAADYRNGNLTDFGHWRSETVAEFGGAVLLKILGHEHDADLGGCLAYIKTYIRPKKMSVLKACNMVLERTCQAVSLILDTYHEYRKEILWEKLA